MHPTIKPSYLLLGSVLMLTSCSQEVVVPALEGAGTPIVFRTSLPGLSSRAVETTRDNMDYFHITAFNPSDPDLNVGGSLMEHFANERIEIVEGVDKYSSENCIWPKQGYESHEVTFFAYYPALNDSAFLENKSTVGSFDYKLKNFKVEPQISDQIDFVTAYTHGSMERHVFSGIDLAFSHQLSRIEINAWSANKSCDIEIAGIRLGGVGIKGTFDFKTVESGGEWVDDATKRGIVEYIFSEGETIVSLPNVNSDVAVKTADDALSIMGKANCAMLIPSTYAEWDLKNNDRTNASNRMFISVLLRITDATPTSGDTPKDPQRYPYRDLSQGANSLDIPKLYFAIEKSTGKIIKRLDKDGNIFGTDTTYDLPSTEEVKEFGWAALPVSATWKPGNIYTYTLDYTSGIGLHDPEVETASPAAGDPVISDKVGVSYDVKDWNDGGGNGFVVPGS